MKRCALIAKASGWSLLTATLLLLAMFGASPAQAWGWMGHRLVGSYAEIRLNEVARAEVARLLAGEQEPTLAGVSTWADELRNDPVRGPATASWHFVNFERGQCHFDAARFCPDGSCIVAAIERYQAVLTDRSRPQLERSEALKFLVHFVADLHQPLHAGYFADRGGNRFQISYQREGWNLHSVWDSLILRSGGLDEEGYLSSIQTRLTRPPAQGTPTSWAEDSCRLVQNPDFYPPRHKITGVYLDAKRPLAEAQLARAGERLAGLLNAALGEQ
jgi:nuclease S1